MTTEPAKQVGSQTYYTIRSASKTLHTEIDYTFVDNYLVAAPDAATISRAIQIRQAGFGLTHSSTFQALLPSDGYTNFSGIFYHNIGPGGWSDRGAVEVERCFDTAAASIHRRSDGELGARLDLRLRRARPDPGGEQHGLHGIRSGHAVDDGT